VARGTQLLRKRAVRLRTLAVLYSDRAALLRVG
jgi:hypothetical protein